MAPDPSQSLSHFSSQRRAELAISNNWDSQRIYSDAFPNNHLPSIDLLHREIQNQGFATVAITRSRPGPSVCELSTSSAVDPFGPDKQARCLLEIHDCRGKGPETAERILAFVSNFLSEPYSTYSIRYFIQQFPHFSYLSFELPPNTTATTVEQATLHDNKDGFEICPSGAPTIRNTSSDGKLVGVLIAREEVLDGVLDSPTAPSSEDRHIATTKLVGWPRLLEPFEPPRGFPNLLRTGYLGMVAIAKEKRRHGIATLLVNLILYQFSCKGHLEVLLETVANNVPAVTFYERLGFVKLARHPRYYAGGVDAITMVKPLQIGCIQRLPFWNEISDDIHPDELDDGVVVQGRHKSTNLATSLVPDWPA